MIEQRHIDEFADWFHALVDHIGVIIKGKRDEIAMVLVCVLSEGHVLLEDYPGTGKTSLAKSIAHLIGGDWRRVQFTPDLLPADVTGGLIFNQKTAEFDHRRGPIFANVLLADEINRASPKTQAALLEAMEERQVTTGNETHALPRPFVVIATQNPDEQLSGTYQLPDAQLDRFLMRLRIGYPLPENEVEVLANVADGVAPSQLPQLMTPAEFAQLIAWGGQVHVSDEIRRYIVDVVNATREMRELRAGGGVSPRGAIALMKASRALAAAQGRPFVKADDVKSVAHAVMEHRLLLSAQAEMDHVSTSDLVERALKVPTPDNRGV